MQVHRSNTAAVKRLRTLSIAIAALLLTIPYLVSERANADDVATDLTRNQVQNLDAPGANTAGPNATTKASVKAAGDNSGASTQIAYAWGLSSLNGVFIGRILAAAPFSDSNTPKPDTGSVSSLSAGVNTRLDANLLLLPWWGDNKATTIKAYQDNLNSACNAFMAAVLGNSYYWVPDNNTPKNDPRVYGANFNMTSSCGELTDPVVLQDQVNKWNAAIDKRNTERAKPDATDHSPRETHITLVSGWADTAKAAAARLLKVEQPHFSLLQGFGVSILGNQHNNSFVMATAPTKVIKQSDEGYGIGVNYTALLRSASIIVGYSYERPFKTGMSQQICSPLGTTTSSSCSTAEIGAPVRTTAHIISLETRFLPFGPALGLGPRIEYDTTSANLGVKLPVYFVSDAKKVLTGGLEVGWTKTAGYQGTVVIEKAFNFLE